MDNSLLDFCREGKLENKMQPLRGKVALITGASSGLGAAMAEYFSKQGARLSLAGRNQDNLNGVAAQTKLPKEEILTTAGDIARSEDRRILIDRTVDKFGNLDVLINNAGIINYLPLEEVTEQHYDDIFNINLKAHVFLSKLAIPHLLKTKGNIVNISSASAFILPKTQGVYSMTKVALDAYTKVLAAELGPRGVRVNSVNPGFIPATNVFERSNLSNVDEMQRICIDLTPLKRVGTPEEVAIATAFLASDQASFVTGEIMVVDGGVRLG